MAKKTPQEILDLKKPLEGECEILIDPSYQEKIRELEEQKLEIERTNRAGGGDLSKGVGQIQKKVDALYEEASDYIITFKGRDIGRKRRDQLIAKYPPTKEQIEHYKEIRGPGVLEFNVDEFCPALCAEVYYDPKFSLEEWQQIFESWGYGEIDILWNTALRITMGRAGIPKSRSATAAT